jgi:hypothetical protein
MAFHADKVSMSGSRSLGCARHPVERLKVTEVVERFMVSGSGDKDSGQRFFHWLKDQLRADNLKGVAETFLRLLIPGLDYTTATSLHRILMQLQAAGGPAPERMTVVELIEGCKITTIASASYSVSTCA